MARPTGSRFDEMSDIEQQLMSIDFELLFEVLRAANYLGCADLLKLASRAVANLLGSLRDDPEHLAAVLGLSRGSSSPRTSSSLASVRPWSTVWSALVNEPVLEPPDDIDEAQSLTALDEDHRYGIRETKVGERQRPLGWGMRKIAPDSKLALQAY